MDHTEDKSSCILYYIICYIRNIHNTKFQARPPLPSGSEDRSIRLKYCLHLDSSMQRVCLLTVWIPRFRMPRTVNLLRIEEIGRPVLVLSRRCCPLAYRTLPKVEKHPRSRSSQVIGRETSVRGKFKFQTLRP
jgi:hypothetical protein